MQHVPPFLHVLGVDTDADSRAIRRAYARKLKQIDQEADPAGFQRLREAYETALAWDGWRSRSQAGDVPPPAAEPAPLDPPVEAWAHIEPETAGAVLQERASSATSAAAPQPSAAAPFTEEPARLAESVFRDLDALSRQDDRVAWHDALERSLDDARLFNVGARIAFEELVAQRLAGSWQPGKEALFLAAIEVFGWATDRRRLLNLGGAGGLINQAIDETALFDSQPAQERTALRKAIGLLQSAEPPDETVLRRKAVDFYKLMTRFPALVSITANPLCAAGWRERYEQLPPRKRGEKKLRMPKLGKFGSYVYLVFIALAILVNALRPGHRNHPPASLPPYRGTQQPRPPEPAPLPVTQDRIDEIASRIHYKPGRSAKEGKTYIVYQVFIDADGKVFGLNRKQWEGDPAYHEAVKKAIMETKPFPPGTRTMFELRFSIELRKKKVPALKPDELERLRNQPVPVPLPVAAPALPNNGGL